jgi:hypothetical protein
MLRIGIYIKYEAFILMIHLEVADSHMVFSYVIVLAFIYFSCVFGTINIYYS